VVMDRTSGYGNTSALYTGFNANLASVSDVYPFGMLIADRYKAFDDYQFGVNGQMKSDEIYGKGNLNTALFWEYDTRLARRWNIDPVDQVNISNYTCFRNNPLYFVDVEGNTVNTAELKKSNSQANDALINDLQSKTGLQLSTDKDGNMTYAKGSDNKPVVASNPKGKPLGSKAARKELIDAIDSKKHNLTVAATTGQTGVTMDGVDPNRIQFNPSEMENNIANTSADLDPTTYGWALTFFHEIGHTKYKGSGNDPAFTNPRTNGYESGGQMEILPNKIRRQLGQSYGQRLSYNSFPILKNGKLVNYYPFTRAALSRIKSGKEPTSGYIIQTPNMPNNEK